MPITYLRFYISVDQPQRMDLLQPRQKLQPQHRDRLVAELELAHLEEIFQVRAQQLHDQRVELGAPRAARPDLEYLRKSRLQYSKIPVRGGGSVAKF